MPRVRWFGPAPEAVLLARLALFVVDETDAALSSLGSARANTIVAVAGVTWIAARLVTWRTVRWVAARVTIFAVAAIAALAVVVLPAYDDTTVIEAFPGPAATTARPDAPVLLRSGSFTGIDHRATGTVNIYRNVDGSYVVGLEAIDVQPGPDYDVYLAPGGDRSDVSGATRLDDLRGNLGTQFYPVPPDVDIVSGPWTVLIWCQTFGVPIANSTPLEV